MGFASATAASSDPGSPLAEPDIVYLPRFLAGRSAASLSALVSELSLRPDALVIAGSPILTRRLHDFRSDPGASYHYSGAEHRGLPWTPLLSWIRTEIQGVFGSPFNSCLCNYYPDGKVAMGWHADNERELGPSPNIASASFGSTRLFRFRKRAFWREAKGYQTWDYGLADGDLLLMRGRTQLYFEHELPARPKVDSPRLNLTFRLLHRSSPANGTPAPL